MCGIWALFGYDSTEINNYSGAFEIAHRGPDCFQVQNIKMIKNCSMAFHRLCAVDNVRGMQPMTLTQYPHLTLMCNGEIYNFNILKEEFGFQFESACDIEIILHLYQKFGIEKAAQLLDGVFAFLILDTQTMKVVLCRDTYGVRPMFYFNDKSNGTLGLCSEAKGLISILKSNNGEDRTSLIQPFPPAHFMTFSVDEKGKVLFENKKKFHSFTHQPLHSKYQAVQLLEGNDLTSIKENIKSLFINAVEKRLMTGGRLGSLLSGGLDSSLVAAFTARKLKEQQCKLPLQTFAIGFESSPDIIAARKVAEHIGSVHHEVIISIQEALDAVEKAIYLRESYDIVTIRASIPMYLLTKYISENTDTNVIMSGKGADELAQGYIYFHKQPSPEDGDRESKRLLEDSHYYDVHCIDRTNAAHGLEVRAPFLDHLFTSYFLSLPANIRCPVSGIEKHLIRSSFENMDLIPQEILWRQKEEVNDGIASIKKSWFTILQEHVETKISSEQLADAANRFPHCPPLTKEAYYYRDIFSKSFGENTSKLVPYFWMPKWVGECKDPSARLLSDYKNDEATKYRVE